jgi:hypothetical protein
VCVFYRLSIAKCIPNQELFPEENQVYLRTLIVSL